MANVSLLPSIDSGAQVFSTRYVVITPVRDEAEHLEHTIRSMVAQTVRPAQWILVNDGSTDATGDIIERWAAEHDWIMPVHLSDRPSGEKASRGKRAVEAKEIEAFYKGVSALTCEGWEFIVKLDGDLGFEQDYFQRCFAEFLDDAKLGIGGGEIYNLLEGHLQTEPNPGFHVRGATKIYRRACWTAIGGVIPSAGWDTLDEVKANMLGWSTRTFSQLQVTHYRFTGAANGLWRNAVKNGMWSYIAGYHPVYMVARCAKGIFRHPVILGSAGLFYGYLQGYLQQVEQANDRQLIEYLRSQQLARLFSRPTIWK